MIRAHVGGPGDFADMSSKYEATIKGDAAARKARETEIRKSTIEPLKSVFNAIFPGAGDAMVWAYGVVEGIGNVINGIANKDENTQEQKDRASDLMRRLFEMGVEPRAFDGAFFSGAKSYADSLEWWVGAFEAMARPGASRSDHARASALKLMRDLSIEYASDPEIAALNAIDWTFAPGTNPGRYAMKFGALAALRGKRDVRAIQERAFAAWDTTWHDKEAYPYATRAPITHSGSATSNSPELYGDVALAALDAACVDVPGDTRIRISGADCPVPPAPTFTLAARASRLRAKDKRILIPTGIGAAGAIAAVLYGVAPGLALIPAAIGVAIGWWRQRSAAGKLRPA